MLSVRTYGVDAQHMWCWCLAHMVRLANRHRFVGNHHYNIIDG